MDQKIKWSNAPNVLKLSVATGAVVVVTGVAVANSDSWAAGLTGGGLAVTGVVTATVLTSKALAKHGRVRKEDRNKMARPELAELDSATRAAKAYRTATEPKWKLVKGVQYVANKVTYRRPLYQDPSARTIHPYDRLANARSAVDALASDKLPQGRGWRRRLALPATRQGIARGKDLGKG